VAEESNAQGQRRTGDGDPMDSAASKWLGRLVVLVPVIVVFGVAGIVGWFAGGPFRAVFIVELLAAGVLLVWLVRRVSGR